MVAQRPRKGLRVSRRELLAWCGAGVATVALISASKALASDLSLGFDDFLAAANDAAEELLQDQGLAGQFKERLLGFAMPLPLCLRADRPVEAVWLQKGRRDQRLQRLV